MTNNLWGGLINGGQYSNLNSFTLSNSATLTDISPGQAVAGQAFTFPADYLQPGMQFRVTAGGVYSTTGSPSMGLGLYYGGVAGVALGSFTATMPSGVTNLGWYLDALLRVYATGTSGKIHCAGMSLGIANSAYGGCLNDPGPNVDTTTSKILTLGAQWSAASASNTITCSQFAIEQIA